MDNWWDAPEELLEVEIESLVANRIGHKMSVFFHWRSKQHGWGTIVLHQREVGVNGKMAYDLDAEMMPKEFVMACLAKLIAGAKVRG